jgi:hypothetical protein
MDDTDVIRSRIFDRSFELKAAALWWKATLWGQKELHGISQDSSMQVKVTPMFGNCTGPIETFWHIFWPASTKLGCSPNVHRTCLAIKNILQMTSHETAVSTKWTKSNLNLKTVQRFPGASHKGAEAGVSTWRRWDISGERAKATSNGVRTAENMLKHVKTTCAWALHWSSLSFADTL